MSRTEHDFALSILLTDYVDLEGVDILENKLCKIGSDSSIRRKIIAEFARCRDSRLISDSDLIARFEAASK